MLKLNLGCGPHALQGWKNLDLESHPNVERFDLRKPLQFAPESVSFIFSEHFIEHLTKDEAVRLLISCYRLLVPGGVLRLSTPDLQHLAFNYLQGRVDTYAPGWNPATPCDMMNGGMRLWGHQYLWDRADLFSLLGDIGFTLSQPGYRKSSHPELNALEVRPFFNDIIVEATK